MTSTPQAVAHEGSVRPSSDELALTRTILAHERTIMAWIRTSASMISFGFGIYKFFDYFQADRPVHQGFVTPRRFAIFLMALGLVVLAGAAVQHWSDLRHLRSVGKVPRSLAGLVAALMAIIGIFALFTAVLRD
jgi:putative membrane protein